MTKLIHQLLFDKSLSRTQICNQEPIFAKPNQQMSNCAHKKDVKGECCEPKRVSDLSFQQQLKINANKIREKLPPCLCASVTGKLCEIDHVEEGLNAWYNHMLKVTRTGAILECIALIQPIIDNCSTDCEIHSDPAMFASTLEILIEDLKKLIKDPST